MPGDLSASTGQRPGYYRLAGKAEASGLDLEAAAPMSDLYGQPGIEFSTRKESAHRFGLFTSRAHGIERFANGLGSPGSRNDVWDSDEFRKIAPKLGNVAKNVVLPPSPPMDAWHHPANGRFAEHEPILLNEWVKVSLGQLEVEKYAQDVSKQIQDILDKPPV